MTITKPAKLEYINAVRGIAILLVIMLHVSRAVIKGLPNTFSYICSKGEFGVQLFFIASAFTLFLSFSNRIKQEGEHANYNFFVRRFFRISPMYYLSAIVYGIVCYYHPAYNDGKPLVIWKVLANVFYVNDFIPGTINYLPPGGWSVGVEMAFYCCVPFLFSRIKDIKTAIKWFAVLAIGAVVLKLVIRCSLVHLSIDYHNAETWFLYFWFPNQASVFLLGIILFFSIKKYTVKSKLKAYAGLLISTVSLCIFSYFVTKVDYYYVVPEHIIVSMFFALNIFYLSQHSFILFNNKITRFFGEISFSLYLIHFLVVYLAADYISLPGNPIIRYFTLLAITLVISSIIAKTTYQLIELNGIKLGNKLIRRKPIIPELNPGL